MSAIRKLVSILSTDILDAGEEQSFAELDLVIQFNDLVIPVEVKPGKLSILRSLRQFVNFAPHHFAVRIYSGILNEEKQKTINGKEFYFLNLPIYLTGNIFYHFDWFINTDLPVRNLAS